MFTRSVFYVPKLTTLAYECVHGLYLANRKLPRADVLQHPFLSSGQFIGRKFRSLPNVRIQAMQ